MITWEGRLWEWLSVYRSLPWEMVGFPVPIYNTGVFLGMFVLQAVEVREGETKCWFLPLIAI